MCNQCRQSGPILLPELEELLGMPVSAMAPVSARAPKAPAAPPQPKIISLTNTDLDAPYFGGNFDFSYSGGNEATVTFRTFLSFRKKYPAADINAFISRLRDAVGVWDRSARVQLKDSSGNFSKNITLRFQLQLVQHPGDANKTTDVHPTGTWSSWFTGKDRAVVMRDMNVYIGTTRNTFVHELGHVWGLLDEYDAGWLENHFSPGHVDSDSPSIKDVRSVMNIGYEDPNDGGEFRARFFTHFGRALAGAFWGMPDFINPVIRNGKTLSRTIQGRIVLLKKNIAGDPPYSTDQPPLNPVFSHFQVANL